MNLAELFVAAKLAADLTIGEIQIDLVIQPDRLEIIGVATEKHTRMRHSVRDVILARYIEELPLSRLEDGIRMAEESLKRMLVRERPKIDWPVFAAEVWQIMQAKQYSYRDVGISSGVDKSAIHRLVTDKLPISADNFALLKHWIEEEKR